MPNRVTGLLLIFFLLASLCFALALRALVQTDDMLAVAWAVAGGLALLALSRAVRVAERNTR